MDISQAQKASSFRVTNLDPGTARAAEVPGIENNQRVDLVVADKSGSYLLSGDKVSLSELRKAAPDVALEVAIFDRDQDGFLVEPELKYTTEEKLVHLLKYAEQTHKNNGSKSSLGLTKPNTSLYRTPEWNHTDPRKDEQRMSFSNASSAERKSNLTMVGSLDDMPMSPLSILRTAR